MTTITVTTAVAQRRRLKRKQLKLAFVLTIFSLFSFSINSCNCDLTLFANPSSVGDDYLEKLSRSCLDQIDKNRLCSDYCNKLVNKQNESDLNDNADKASAGLNNIFDYIKSEKRLLNLTSSLHYYRSFIHRFLTTIDHEEITEDKFYLTVEVEVKKHQVKKLSQFAQSANETYELDYIHDITDIMKNMLLGKSQSINNELCNNQKNGSFFDWLWTPLQVIFVLVMVTAILFLLKLFLVNKVRFNVQKSNLSWRMIIGAGLLLMFTISAINNHSYLTQKKQILNQQRLREMIPEECLLKNADEKQQVEDKGMFRSFFKMVKKQFGYSPTSRKCLEYQEALYITGKQINYIETIVFTLSESIRPLALSFGEFINEFYSALTKDLSFYQYMPLIILVTAVLAPFSLYFLSLISLLLFNYEFNFFHLISFRKSSPPPVDPRPSLEAIEAMDKEKKELIKILNNVRLETRKLSIKYEKLTSKSPKKQLSLSNETTPKCINSKYAILAIQDQNVSSSSESNLQLVANQSLEGKKAKPENTIVFRNSNNNILIYNADSDSIEDNEQFSLDSPDLNVTLEKSLRFYLDRINSKEAELKNQVDSLLSENQRLSEMLSNNSTSKELLMLNESGDYTSNNSQSVSSQSDKKIVALQQNSKQVVIGQSKTISKMTLTRNSIDKSSTEIPPFIGDHPKTRRSGGGGKQDHYRHHENEYDEEDDEEDIYVILDEN